MPSPSLNREYASTGSAFSASPRLSDYASMPSGPSSPQPLITPVERLGYYANNHGRQSSYFEQGSQYGTSSYSAIPTGIVPAHPSWSSHDESSFRTAPSQAPVSNLSGHNSYSTPQTDDIPLRPLSLRPNQFLVPEYSQHTNFPDPAAVGYDSGHPVPSSYNPYDQPQGPAH